MDGAELIAEERQRQIEQEGWAPEHDDTHTLEELATAGALYALPRKFRDRTIWGESLLWKLWPWESSSWKPTDYEWPPKVTFSEDARLRDLAKAGALIAAEMDRLLRQRERRLNRVAA